MPRPVEEVLVGRKVRIVAKKKNYCGELQSVWSAMIVVLTCSIPDDHIDPRRTAFFVARSILAEFRDGR